MDPNKDKQIFDAIKNPAPCSEKARRAAIATLNDAFRARLPFHQIAGSPAGQTVITRGLALQPSDTITKVLIAVATFSAFNPGNDPHDEHDFALFELDGERYIWKIDYYADRSLTYGAEDPRDCYRVLTVMLAGDY